MTDSPFFTVSQGGPPPDQDIPNGVYPVVLRAIADPRSVDITRGPKAGQSMDLIDWEFVIHAPGSSEHERILEGSTSTATGSKSKAFAWITALNGGRPPVVGQQFTKADLIGKAALATVDHGEDGGGWPRIANLGAIPASMMAQQVAAATGAPFAGVPTAAAAPLRQQVEGQVGDLPF